MAPTTAFRYEILAALNSLHDQPSGQEVRRHIERHNSPESTDDVNRSRLYPNLDKLVDDGLLKKGEQDRRTNYYVLTDAGRDQLAARAALFSEVPA